MIRVIAVGKLKEKYLEDAVKEYSKRLSAYTKLEIVQVPDESAGADLSLKEEKIIKDKEASEIIKHINKNEYVIALEIKGKLLSSEEFSQKIEQLSVSGIPDITFVIGGSIGLGDSVLQRADLSLSFSRMTFPHQLMRVILLEQIYRAYKIMKNEPYHK